MLRSVHRFTSTSGFTCSPRRLSSRHGRGNPHLPSTCCIPTQSRQYGRTQSQAQAQTVQAHDAPTDDLPPGGTGSTSSQDLKGYSFSVSEQTRLSNLRRLHKQLTSTWDQLPETKVEPAAVSFHDLVGKAPANINVPSVVLKSFGGLSGREALGELEMVARYASSSTGEMGALDRDSLVRLGVIKAEGTRHVTISDSSDQILPHPTNSDAKATSGGGANAASKRKSSKSSKPKPSRKPNTPSIQVPSTAAPAVGDNTKILNELRDLLLELRRPKSAWQEKMLLKKATNVLEAEHEATSSSEIRNPKPTAEPLVRTANFSKPRIRAIIRDYPTPNLLTGLTSGRTDRRKQATRSKSPPTKRSITLKNVPDFSEDEPAASTVKHANTEVPQPLTLKPPSDALTMDTSFIKHQALVTEDQPKVPQLSHDLSRVLFNPGVYHLQDPRSRVYNFDPYLEKIMPITEFNFAALNPYHTSSEDSTLQDFAQKHEKKYVGSSSSMTAAMSQFHFLLSAWRPIDSSILSKKIQGLDSFTVITRAPASIFLRRKSGLYAVDADKEHDSPNVLMMQGKSMEKLLTLEKNEFEKYRRPKDDEPVVAIDCPPEAYHYSTVENFLLRSQLDAHDPRLPGTGMFDLKTRAVAGIRMNMSDYEVGMGYELKDRFGTWESFDREYFDMIRAAFLKYSLQVRMGRMDGIFVAYHNITRIFGFQYISLAEMDMALHGQTNPTIGDREYRMTLKLMNEVFDQATTRCPDVDFRFVFETKEPTKTNPFTSMKIFAETMTDAEIKEIQTPVKAKMEDYELNMSQGINPGMKAPKTFEEFYASTKEKATDYEQSPSTLESTTANTSFLDKVFGLKLLETQSNRVEETPVVDETVNAQPSETPLAPKTLIAWTLRVWHEVNGVAVIRPSNLKPTDRWVVRYTLEEDSGKIDTLYTAVKRRRATALVRDVGEGGSNFFIEKINNLSRSGKVWRAEQDLKDANTPATVLYDQSPPKP